MSDDTYSTLSLAADIVASFVSNNSIAPSEIGGLVQSVKAALDGSVQPTAEPTLQEPAHSLRKLVTPDAIFCAECGKKFKSLKRHLRTEHDLTPHDYRAKWGLKKDSPMVAPNYSAARSDLAKTMGLGQGGRQAATPAAANAGEARTQVTQSRARRLVGPHAEAEPGRPLSPSIRASVRVDGPHNLELPPVTDHDPI